ncbi:MAG: DUF4038 domain-containing protein [Candidatus Nanopelagicales bacterium]
MSSSAGEVVVGRGFGPDTTGAAAWQQVEIELTARHDHADPYNDIEVWADFRSEDGETLRRPAFWDGGQTWRVRFAPLGGSQRWTWLTAASVADPGLADQQGEVTVSDSSDVDDPFSVHGFWRMSPGGRSLIHADGTPALMVADTAWALPWRATAEDVGVYAADRQAKGFNAALLMTVQPDMRAIGPRDRTADEGFDVGFEDLSEGHLTQLNPEYFQTFDDLVGILRRHGIVGVLSPVFFGFGWKGLDVAGRVIPPSEYARYCRYLVARYGAGPVVYLPGADGSGKEPQVRAGGEEIERWDCYGQPTGLHYQPHADNAQCQDAGWLDFQSCQTGHTGEHVAERVADMWRNSPAKGVMNGEPTYEGTRSRDMASGWWQGHEAWSNLCAGGTMGVVYGAASLWQWVLRPDEPGHLDYFTSPGCSWRDALDFPGSTYVGLVGRILAGLPTTDMEPAWRYLMAARALIVPGRLVVHYSATGQPFMPLSDQPLPTCYRVVDPRSGAVVASGRVTEPVQPIYTPGDDPRVIVLFDEAGFEDTTSTDVAAP